jgi:hypothetical protein
MRRQVYKAMEEDGGRRETSSTCTCHLRHRDQCITQNGNRWRYCLLPFSWISYTRFPSRNCENYFKSLPRCTQMIQHRFYRVRDPPGRTPRLTAGSDFCHHQWYFRLPYMIFQITKYKIMAEFLIRYAGVTWAHLYAVQTIQLINLHRFFGIAFAIFGFSHYFGTQTRH